MTLPPDRREGATHVMYAPEHSRFERKHNNIGIIFPGQTVRELGMFDKWMEFPAGKELLERGNKILKEECNMDILDMAKTVENEDEAETKKRAAFFQQARFTVPAVYLLSMAIHNVNKFHKRKDGYKTIPGYVTGISMGMGTAAVLAGYMDFETGLRFHAERGKIMQEESDPTPTSMVTLVGDEEKIQSYLRRPENASLDICLINDDALWVVGGPDNPEDPNSPMQRLRREFKGYGFKRAMEVGTDRAMHGRYVRPARTAFDALVETTPFNKPHSVVISSLTGLPINSEEGMRDELKLSFDHTVDNRKPPEFMKANGIHVVYEVGNEKGFFAKMAGNHLVQVAAVGTVGVGALAVGAAEVWTHHHPHHPENGKKN